MNPNVDRSAWPGFISHALIWLVLVAACVLLAWFVAVLHGVTERGEQRRMQQLSLGTLLLPDEVKARGETGHGTPLVRTETAVAR